MDPPGIPPDSLPNLPGEGAEPLPAGGSCPTWCPIPAECRAAGHCRAVRLRLVNDGSVVGVPEGVVGQTLRFRQILPFVATTLVPFRTLLPESLEEVLSAFRGDDPGSPANPSAGGILSAP